MRLLLAILVFLSSLALVFPLPSPGLHSRGLDERQTPLNALLAIILNNIPTIDGTISEVSGALTALELLLASLTRVQTTYNQLGDTCKEYTLIFARGTTEPGNVGVLVGPPLILALQGLVGESALTIQGVNNYDASVKGYLAGGDPGGSTAMAEEITQAYAACPNTKLTAAGYSQGGQIVHNAIAELPAAIAKWISSVVIFGDPDKGQPLNNVDASAVDTFCSDQDDICINGDLILPVHLSYGSDAQAAAAFIVAQAS